MGMYTALHFTVALKPDTPDEVIDLLQYMLDVKDYYQEQPPLPDHPLFRTDRWRIMLVCDSYSFEADSHSVIQRYPSGAGWQLSVMSNFKNYDNELAHFLAWIMPHVDADYRRWLGYWMYEDDEEPTPIYYPPEGSS